MQEVDDIVPPTDDKHNVPGTVAAIKRAGKMRYDKLKRRKFRISNHNRSKIDKSNKLFSKTITEVIDVDNLGAKKDPKVKGSGKYKSWHAFGVLRACFGLVNIWAVWGETCRTDRVQTDMSRQNCKYTHRQLPRKMMPRGIPKSKPRKRSKGTKHIGAWSGASNAYWLRAGVKYTALHPTSKHTHKTNIGESHYTNVRAAMCAKIWRAQKQNIRDIPRGETSISEVSLDETEFTLSMSGNTKQSVSDTDGQTSRQTGKNRRDRMNRRIGSRQIDRKTGGQTDRRTDRLGSYLE